MCTRNFEANASFTVLIQSSYLALKSDRIFKVNLYRPDFRKQAKTHPYTLAAGSYKNSALVLFSPHPHLSLFLVFFLVPVLHAADIKKCYTSVDLMSRAPSSIY